MKKTTALKLVSKVFFLAFCFAPLSYAQTSDVADEEIQAEMLAGDKDLLLEMNQRISLVKPSIDLSQMSSLFFTPSEQSLIAEARLGLTTRAPTDYELKQAEDGNIPMGPRELSLGGIVYRASSDWTIWLNGQKITPSRLPSEILDIKVGRHSIKLKWFDAYTNQIFPVKLRTHQRFNIDTRIFLPGEGSEAAASQY